MTGSVLLRVLLVWCGFASLTSAHVVQQLFAEVTRGGPDWQVEVLFDVGYANPEGRGDPNAPQPTRDWLVALDPTGQQALCKQSAEYLGECLEFTASRNPATVSYHFVDFERTPPDFPALLTNGAYFRILITPDHPDPKSEIRCTLREGVRPDFVFKSRTNPNADANYLTLRPGESFILWDGLGSSTPMPRQVIGRPPLVHALQQGFLHVLPYGLDHMLFVLGLFLLRRRWRPLVWQSLAFTCAHTLTLGLAAAGILAPRSEWIEPLIALSIASLAIENLFHARLSPWRLPLVFAFGLVHGMGFATALASVLVPGDGFLSRLVATNLGVEVAQIAILSSAWLVTARWSSGTHYKVVRKWANLSLAVTALWWFADRLA